MKSNREGRRILARCGVSPFAIFKISNYKTMHYSRIWPFILVHRHKRTAAMNRSRKAIAAFHAERYVALHGEEQSHV